MLWKTCRKALFALDAEKAHHLAIQSLQLGERLGIFSASKTPQVNPFTCMGIYFPNRIGLAAGLDKNAEAVLGFQALGFGHIEVGTVTALPQTGNPPPRLSRLVKDQALWNRMGFNNEGAKTIANRLEDYRKSGKLRIPVGVNIGKSRVVSLEDAAADYCESFRAVADVADYIVINVSSPNTPNLRTLQAAKNLQVLLAQLMALNLSRHQPLPILLKLSPDLSNEAALEASTIALEQGCKGLVISNTTVSRLDLKEKPLSDEGGISGKPLFQRSTDLLRYLKKELSEKITFVGVGGIVDKFSLSTKWKSGADLAQVYTGFIYGGPFFVRCLLKSEAEVTKT